MTDRTESLELRASDDYRLAATLYRPADPPLAIVVIACATGVRRSYYDPFARYLADHGLAALTFDYRGIGDSRPQKLPGFTATMHDWGALDLDAALARALELFPGVPLQQIGHSAGGQLVGLSPHADRLNAIFSVAAQSGWYGHWRGLGRARMIANWFLAIPVATRLFGYLPGQLGTGQHLPAGVARQWAAWCRHPDYLMSEDRQARAASFARVTAPILAYSFSDDPFAPRAAVDQLVGFFTAAPHERRHLTPSDAGGGAPIGHFGFFRKKFAESLWPAPLAWLTAQAAGQAAGSPTRTA
jgi:predicted alpha/beta hydrolase